MALIRGSLVTVVLQGAYGKPRPALIIQSNLFDQHPSVTILPITSKLREAPLFRFNIQPNTDNGLKKISQAMLDKAHTIPIDKVGKTIGKLSKKRHVANQPRISAIFWSRLILKILKISEIMQMTEKSVKILPIPQGRSCSHLQNP